MRIFFDVDETLISWDWKLRPHVEEVFARIRAEGHELYLWSGLGERWEVVERHHLGSYVLGCYRKPLWDHRRRLSELGIPFAPDFVVDDYREVVDAFGGTHVRPARAPFADDREMWRAYEEFTAFVAS